MSPEDIVVIEDQAKPIVFHPKQQELVDVINPNRRMRRFAVAVWGRRTGKTKAAVWWLITCSLKATRGVGFYVAPTLQQAKDIAWDEFKRAFHALSKLFPGLTATFIENTGEIRISNGMKIMLKGSDRPDTLRGVDLFAAVVDEYGDMKADVFDGIILPALAGQEAPALIIGTPKGFNHFHDLVNRAKTRDDWFYSTATMYDNPYIPRSAIIDLKNTMSTFLFEQEIMAKFKVASSDLFKEEWIREAKEPTEGDFYVACDLAGFDNFAEAQKKSNPMTHLDDTAIAVGKLHGLGHLWVKDIDSGRWSVRENASRIVRHCRENSAMTLGIEKGALYQAVFKDVQDAMRTQGHYARIQELTHGNQGKVQRLLWALQGALEHGKITFNPGKYLNKFKDQLMNIPHKGTHDDLPDALALLVQLVPGQALDGKPSDLFYDYILGDDKDSGELRIVN